MVRLSDIHVSLQQILEFARLHDHDGNTDTSNMFGAGLDSFYSFSTNVLILKKGFSFSLAQSYIQYDCEISPDFTIITEAFLYLSKYPDAQKMFWHYLTGGGEDVEVNTNRVLGDDDAMRKYVIEKIKVGMAKGDTHGSFSFGQQQYSAQNWRMAFGAINIRWAKTANVVNVWFDDTYKWHPNEPRVTQCVHQAMNRARKYGAQEFYYYGTKVQMKASDFAMEHPAGTFDPTSSSGAITTTPDSQWN